MILWCILFFFFFKQRPAYEMRISDWSSDVCSSDLREVSPARVGNPELDGPKPRRTHPLAVPIYLVSPLLDRGHVNLHRYHAKLHDTSLTAPPQVPSLRFASGVPQGRRRA